MTNKNKIFLDAISVESIKLSSFNFQLWTNISRAYSQSHELCPEEWENEQRANSCCYRSHSGIIHTVSSIKCQESSRGDIYGARKVGQGFSPAHQRIRESELKLAMVYGQWTVDAVKGNR